MTEITPMFAKKDLWSGANQPMTTALFVETAIHGKDNILFTFENEPHSGYLSFPKLYRKFYKEDPTEYLFAMTVFGSWEHWTRLLNSSVRPRIEQVRKEAEAYLDSQMVGNILKEANSGSRNSFTASKYILERGYRPKDERPTKLHVKKNVEKAIEDSSFLSKEYERLSAKEVQ